MDGDLWLETGSPWEEEKMEINVRPAEYKLFQIIAKTAFGTILYRELRDQSGVSNSCFAHHVCGLVTSGAIRRCGGAHATQPLILNASPSDVVIGKVSTGRKGLYVDNSRPKADNLGKRERKCLKCREKFDSEWVGMETAISDYEPGG